MKLTSLRRNRRIKLSWGLVFVYLLFGGFVLSYLEYDNEANRLEEFCSAKRRMGLFLDKKGQDKLKTALKEYAKSSGGVCKVPTCGEVTGNYSNITAANSTAPTPAPTAAPTLAPTVLPTFLNFSANSTSNASVSSSTNTTTNTTSTNSTNTTSADSETEQPIVEKYASRVFSLLFGGSDTHLNWGFLGACFFCLTAITTIGYGVYAPSTLVGRLFTIIYTFVGIFIFWYANFALAVATERQSTKLAHRIFDHKSLKFVHKGKDKEGREVHLTAQQFKRRVRIIMMIMEITLLVMWWLLMASYYSWREGWAFFDSFYFSFVTLTTIGFGDFAPTLTRDDPMNYMFICVGFFLASVLISTVSKDSVGASEQQLERLRSGQRRGMWQIVRSEFRMAWLLFLLFVYTFLGGAMFRQLEAKGATLSMSMFLDTMDDMVRGNLTTKMTGEMGLGVDQIVGGAVSTGSGVFGREAVSEAAMDELIGKMTLAWNCASSQGGGSGGGKALDKAQGGDKEDVWTLMRSSTFVFQIYTTLGYGDMAPASSGGRVLVMIYFVPGVWLFSLIIAEMNTWLDRRILRSMLKRMKRYNCLPSDDEDENTAPVASDSSRSSSSCFAAAKAAVVAFVQRHLHEITSISFLLGFMSMAGMIFAYTESWFYREALWFTFATVTTVGFGDFVPSFGEGGNAVVWTVQVAHVLIGISLWSLVFSVITSNVEVAPESADDDDDYEQEQEANVKAGTAEGAPVAGPAVPENRLEDYGNVAVVQDAKIVV